MLKRSLLVILTLTLLAGCTAYRDVSRERLETLPQHYSQFDLRLTWKTTVTDTETLIEGAAQNIRYPQMDNLEIWVSALDSNGRNLARSVSYVIPSRLNQDETAPFDLKLSLAVKPGSKLQFTYRYRALEDSDDAVSWMQNFEADVPQR